MKIKLSSETNFKDKSSEILNDISKKCISCRNILSKNLDRKICNHCGVINK